MAFHPKLAMIRPGLYINPDCILAIEEVPDRVPTATGKPTYKTVIHTSTTEHDVLDTSAEDVVKLLLEYDRQKELR